MQEVVACGYLVLTGADPAAWRRFATALGMQVASVSTDSQLLLRIDDRAFRVCVERGANARADGVAAVGWEVASEAALDALVARLRRANVTAEHDDDLARRRGVDRLVRCRDPGGNALELYVGANTPKEPHVSPTGTAFVTTQHVHGDLGFGHVVPSFADGAAAWSFYVDLLGFRLTDVCITPNRWYFLRVNGRHHSLAFAASPPPHTYHHFMLQVQTLDMVGMAYDRLLAIGAPIVNQLGKHSNDHMVSFYVRTPSGIEVEYGCGGLLVDDATWKFQKYEGYTLWGNQPAPTPG